MENKSKFGEIENICVCPLLYLDISALCGIHFLKIWHQEVR